MKTNFVFYRLPMFIAFVLVFQIGRTQSTDKKNSIGPSILVFPATLGASAVIVNGEYERFLNEKNSLALRILYLRYSYEEIKSTSTEIGSGNGGGLGFSYKHYFSENGGFFLGPAIELVFLSGTYSYQKGTFRESGTSKDIAICPNMIAGYRINIGEVFSITPSVMLGYRAGVSIEQTGEFDGESGPLILIGANFGFRF